MQATRTIFEYDFSFVAATSGTAVEFDPHDLSRAKQLQLVLKVTTADTDAGDTLDVKIQSRNQAGVWNTRYRFKAITGDLSPSANSPELLHGVLESFGPLRSDEESFEPSGSAGASEPTVIGDGVAINGPFPPLYRTAAGRQATWRAMFVVTDAGTQNASFAGTLYVAAVTEL